MVEESNSNHICILKTGRLLDHDLAANALTDIGIPFYKQMETITGLKLAMPFEGGGFFCYTVHGCLYTHGMPWLKVLLFQEMGQVSERNLDDEK